MRLDLTYGAYRVLTESARESAINSARVLLHLLDEPECRAACWLLEYGISPERVAAALEIPLTEKPADAFDMYRCFLEEEFVTVGAFTPSLGESIEAAKQRCCRMSPQSSLATEHLLFALTLGNDETSRFLKAHNIDAATLYHRITAVSERTFPEETLPPLPLTNFAESHDSSPESTTSDAAVYRILDAAANRAVEGIRVIEDYVRFVRNDGFLSQKTKNLRHELVTALKRLPEQRLLTFRNTEGDIGTAISGKNEYRRRTAADVLRANFSRFQESLRSLEEFGKVVQPDFARAAEGIRYQSYTLEKALFHGMTFNKRLETARLYVLIDARNSVAEFQRLVETIIAGGADILQLREKKVCDRVLWERAKLARQLTAGTDTLLIINDRPDIAKLVFADGVHLGQEEIPVSEARTLIGPDKIIGLSTHSLAQAQEALLQGADYIGVGPVFPSRTKLFDAFPGLKLLQEAASEIMLPAFAIGGITPENCGRVLAAGIKRFAVQSAVTESDDPEAVLRLLKQKIAFDAGM
ncbi:MAG: thiamine phosphate synthase [Planctomycetaceae bacterium]|nr:thiamine phosphate synthase [Planctomycetaceae bacterium]